MYSFRGGDRGYSQNGDIEPHSGKKMNPHSQAALLKHIGNNPDSSSYISLTLSLVTAATKYSYGDKKHPNPERGRIFLVDLDDKFEEQQNLDQTSVIPGKISYFDSQKCIKKKKGPAMNFSHADQEIIVYGPIPRDNVFEIHPFLVDMLVTLERISQENPLSMQNGLYNEILDAIKSGFLSIDQVEKMISSFGIKSGSIESKFLEAFYKDKLDNVYCYDQVFGNLAQSAIEVMDFESLEHDEKKAIDLDIDNYENLYCDIVGIPKKEKSTVKGEVEKDNKDKYMPVDFRAFDLLLYKYEMNNASGQDIIQMISIIDSNIEFFKKELESCDRQDIKKIKCQKILQLMYMKKTYEATFYSKNFLITCLRAHVIKKCFPQFLESLKSIPSINLDKISNAVSAFNNFNVVKKNPELENSEIVENTKRIDKDEINKISNSNKISIKGSEIFIDSRYIDIVRMLDGFNDSFMLPMEMDLSSSEKTKANDRISYIGNTIIGGITEGKIRNIPTGLDIEETPNGSIAQISPTSKKITKPEKMGDINLVSRVPKPFMTFTRIRKSVGPTELDWRTLLQLYKDSPDDFIENVTKILEKKEQSNKGKSENSESNIKKIFTQIYGFHLDSYVFDVQGGIDRNESEKIFFNMILSKFFHCNLGARGLITPVNSDHKKVLNGFVMACKLFAEKENIDLQQMSDEILKSKTEEKERSIRESTSVMATAEKKISARKKLYAMSAEDFKKKYVEERE